MRDLYGFQHTSLRRYDHPITTHESRPWGDRLMSPSVAALILVVALLIAGGVIK